MQVQESYRVQSTGGVALHFADGDAVQLLQARGIPPKRTDSGEGVTLGASENVTEFWFRLKGIRDLAHYRQLVSDERSNGPIHEFPPGAVFTLCRVPSPVSRKHSDWLVIVDTAIGASMKWFENLRDQGELTMVRIVEGE